MSNHTFIILQCLFNPRDYVWIRDRLVFILSGIRAGWPMDRGLIHDIDYGIFFPLNRARQFLELTRLGIKVIVT
jgi:hypothetical protein